MLQNLVPVALEGSATVTAMTSAFTTIQTDAMAALAAVAPLAVGIFGALLVWRLGKRFFVSISK